jgi:hypothetical protein
MLHKETIAFSWETSEYEFKEKRKDWYWIVGTVALALIVLAVILQNYLFAFLIAIGAFLMISLAAKKPLSLPVEISEHGVKVFNEAYTYDSIFNFWITYNKKNEPLLLLLTDRRVSPVISLTINADIDSMELREYLLNFIEEQEMKQSLTDRIIDTIGF